MRHAFTQLQSASPKSAYLVFSLGKSASTLDSGIHLSELCPLHKCTTRLLYNVYNSLLDWRLCVKTARRSPCQRLCETGAQWRLHKVLWVLFLICMAQMSFCSCAGSREGGRESGGDCHMGWSRSVSGKLFQWKNPGRFLAFIVYTPGLINVESFSISHVNAHTETCIGELWYSGSTGPHLGPQMTVGLKDIGHCPALFLHPLLGPFPDPLCLCSLLSSFHAHMHPRDVIMYTHSLMPSDVKCPTLVWQSPDPWSLQSKPSTFPTPSPSYRVYPILLSYPTPPTHPPSHERPQAEALPAGQTLRPAEHKDWVNSCPLQAHSAEAETNAGRFPGLCHSTINSSNQQGNKAHSWGAWHAGMCHQIRKMSSVTTGGKVDPPGS